MTRLRGVYKNNHNNIWGKTVLVQLVLLVFIQYFSNMGSTLFVLGQDTVAPPPQQQQQQEVTEENKEDVPPTATTTETTSAETLDTKTTTTTTASTTSQQQPNSLSLEDLEHVDLDILTDTELEEVCIMRGFELYREIDEDTGEEYQFSHDDYVEAAKQCLAVEREMNEILAEHPELLEELHSEVNHMVEEKKRLDEQMAAAAAKEEEQDSTNGDSTTVEGGSGENEKTAHDDKDEIMDTTTTTPISEDDATTSTTTTTEQTDVAEEDEDTGDSTTSPPNDAVDNNHMEDVSPNQRLTEQQQSEQSQSILQFQHQLRSMSKMITARLHKEFGQKLKILTRLVEEKVPKQIQDPVRQVLVKISPVIHRTFLGVYEFLKTHVEALMAKPPPPQQEKQEQKEAASNDDAQQ